MFVISQFILINIWKNKNFIPGTKTLFHTALTKKILYFSVKKIATVSDAKVLTLVALMNVL